MSVEIVMAEKQVETESSVIDPKKMFVHCSACKHTWVAMYLPMQMSKAANIMKRLTCPKCSNTKSIFMASKEQAIEAGGV